MTQIVMPVHTNGAGGVLFGGVVMQWIDVCGGVAAMRHAGGPVVTASIDRLDFLSPIRLGVSGECPRAGHVLGDVAELSVRGLRRSCSEPGC